MKIAILTQPLGSNYGGLLQNYALQIVLDRLGHFPITLDQREKSLSKSRRLLADIKTLFLHLLGIGKSRRYTPYTPKKKEIAVIRKNTDDFIAKYINRSPLIVKHRDFRKYALKYKCEAYIIGSDQCWRPRYNAFIEQMFLSFLSPDDTSLRISYAASFGTEYWEFDEFLTKRCAVLAQQFNKISVREKSAVQLCSEFLGVSATHVLDPTMLLTRQDYENLISNEDASLISGDLFYYILDPTNEKRELINILSKKLNLKPFKVLPVCQEETRTKKDIKQNIEDCVYPKVTDWLNGILRSKIAIVDSFHGAVFCIIFNTPFWVIANDARGNARFNSLLEIFNLKNRMIEPQSIGKIDLLAPIEWNHVNKLLEDYRFLSLNFLSTALKS